MSTPFGLREVREAYRRAGRWLHRTPVLTSRCLDQLAGRQLFFKAENLQKTGSFKARGACNAVFIEKEINPASPGVVTHSTGNHGQAVAYAAKCAGLPCSVVVPRDTPKVKCSAIEEYGAELVFCEPSPRSRGDFAPTDFYNFSRSLTITQYCDVSVLSCSGLLVFPVEPAGKFLEKSLRSQERLWPNPPQFLDTIADAIRTQQTFEKVFLHE
ncbi:putative serine racemase [Portunus trituberculatus]|uniref:L-serine ammonia-lyase n=1 Tax=Portunus trituberculatus TaxID=210409 RepID=A0A5B7D401_PORTR|nr:putative serine racemase [Portunus trituberculatus]